MDIWVCPETCPQIKSHLALKEADLSGSCRYSSWSNNTCTEIAVKIITAYLMSILASQNFQNLFTLFNTLNLTIIASIINQNFPEADLQ